MIKRYLYPSSVCLKKLRFAATCPNLLPTAVHVPRLLKLHPTTKFVLSRTASTNSQSGLNNEFTSHRYYSKSQPLDKKPKQRRSYKFFIFSIISALVSLHLISLIFRKRYKNKKVRENYKTHQDQFCQGTSGILLKIGKFWLPSEFFKEKYKIQQIKEFTIVDGDILVASFPKSGTTWVQEIVYQILHGSDDSEKSTIEERFPYIEYVYPGLKSLAKSASPHYMKTHLPYDLLPDDVKHGHGKVIYIARNPKDVSVSFFHFMKMLTVTKYSGEFEQFLSSFVDGKVPYGPWPDHVIQYWDKRDEENMLFITYEDLHMKPVEMIKQISSFLGKPIDNKQAIMIAYRCSFRQMESNSLVNYSWWDELGIRDTKQSAFMRKGKVGDWQNHYTPDMVKQVEECCIDPITKKGLDIKDKL